MRSGRLEREVIPMFYERESAGVRHRWIARVKRSLATIGSGFNASRMVSGYLNEVWRAGQTGF